MDKLDYMGRDGYFCGLMTPIDTDRLFVSLSTFTPGAGLSPNTGEPFISVDIGGATVLEQILFNKMLLFSSVYDHHKVRGAFRMVTSILQEIKANHWKINGKELNSAVDFLKLDEYELLGLRNGRKKLSQQIEKIYNRVLPRRALVITPKALKNDESRNKYLELGRQPSVLNDMEKEISKKAGCATVFIDFPPKPHVEKAGQQSMVRLSKKTAQPLSKLYPTSGWIKGYSQYRSRVYVLASPGYEKKVADLAIEMLENKGIKIDKKLCMELARNIDS